MSSAVLPLPLVGRCRLQAGFCLLQKSQCSFIAEIGLCSASLLNPGRIPARDGDATRGDPAAQYNHAHRVD